MTRRRAALVLIAALALAVLLPAILAPRGAPAWVKRASPSPEGPAPRGLPPLFVFILDAHASLGEIERLEEGSGLARRLERSYAAGGFTVYRNAYANFQETILSVPSILNFELAPFPGAVGADYFALPRNRLFEKLLARGYRLSVFQTTYIDFGRTAGAPVDELSIFDPFSARFTAGSGLSAAGEALLLLSRLSPRFGPLPSFYGAFSMSPVLEALRADLADGGADRAYLAHVMAPHAPFVYGADCRVKPVASWVEELCAGCGDAEKKAAYRAYLEQVECTHAKLEDFFAALKRAGAYDDSCIVLFGDHGSNIRDARASVPSAEEKRHNFSSFLAVKPGACGALARPAGLSVDAEKPTAELLNAWLRAVPPESFAKPGYKKLYDRTAWE